MDRVQQTGDEVIITKHGDPVAKLVSVRDPTPADAFGRLKATTIITGDIVSPIGEKWSGDE